ncbi:MAG: cytidylate kinase-like family protein, partial [Anaerolineae bacterium]|nr:cytidylate kinase-like family protein [Anaerolineae bacterium]
GYCKVGKELVLQIAEEAGVDVDAILAMEASFIQRARLVSGEMTSLYRKQATAFEKRGALDDKTYAKVVRDTLEDYARQGDALIVGRGGQMILRDFPGVLHVRLFAGEHIRMQRIAEREGVSEGVALRMVQQSDEQKRQYIRHMFNNADWRNSKYYHLIMDTGRINPEAAAKMISIAVQSSNP